MNLTSHLIKNKRQTRYLKQAVQTVLQRVSVYFYVKKKSGRLLSVTFICFF